MATPAGAQSWQLDNAAAYTLSGIDVRRHSLNAGNRLNLPAWHSELAVRVAARSERLELRVRAVDARSEPSGGTRGNQAVAVEALAGTLAPLPSLTVTAGKTGLDWDPAASLEPLGFFAVRERPAGAFSALPGREGVPLLAARYEPPGWSQGRVTLVLSDQPGYRNSALDRGLGPAASAPTHTRQVDVYQRPRAQAALRIARTGELLSLAGVVRTATGAPVGLGASGRLAPMAGTRLYASGFASRGHNRLQNVLLEADTGAFADRPPFARNAQNDGRLYPRAVAGLSLGGEAMRWWLEASYDARGLGPNQWQRWQDLVATHRNPPSGIGRAQATRHLAWDSRVLAYGPARRRYVQTGLKLDSRTWEGRLWGRWGVADGSLGAGGRLIRKLGPRVAVAAVGAARGARGGDGEFARHPYAGHAGLALRLRF